MSILFFVIAALLFMCAFILGTFGNASDDLTSLGLLIASGVFGLAGVLA